MPTKIRLQRHGKKGRPFYHIVIADGRAPRDGRFIEKIGTYNPIEVPAEIILDFDRAIYWLQTGAQPTDTVRNILSYRGVLYKNHLLKGVTKGALTAEQAELKFQEWMEAKTAKIENASKEIENAGRAEKKKLFEAEVKVNEDRAAAIAKTRADAIEKQVAEAQAKQAAAKAAAEPKVAPKAEAAPEVKVEPEAKPEEAAAEPTEEKSE
jgi:small subunit ribosomal protein S16